MPVDIHLILANKDELSRAIRAAPPDLSGLITAFHEGLNPSHIERLASLLDAGDPTVVQASIPPPSGSTVEVRVLPRSLLERLAEAGADAAATADAWSSAVLAEREWCAQVLTDLVELASKALAEDRHVYAFIAKS